jgi:hypothetical protein
MASIDEYLASRQNLWGEFSSSAATSLAVSEVFCSKYPTTKHQTVHRILKNEELSAWLAQFDDTQSIDGTPSNGNCTLRVAWVPHDRKNSLNHVGDGILDELASHFHHTCAQRRFRATFAGVASLIEPSNGRRTYYFCNHPHLVVTWSRCTKLGLINVVCIAQERKINVLQDMLSCQFVQALAELEVIPALLCSILYLREVDGLLNNIKQQVRQSEVRTGHHGFVSRGEPPAAGDLLGLLADMSGCMSNLAVLSRRLGILRELNRFTIHEIKKFQKTDMSNGSSTTVEEVTSIVKAIQQHSNMQRLDISFFARRAQIQRDAVRAIYARRCFCSNGTGGRFIALIVTNDLFS